MPIQPPILTQGYCYEPYKYQLPSPFKTTYKVAWEIQKGKPLPSGLILDKNTGIIDGICDEEFNDYVVVKVVKVQDRKCFQYIRIKLFFIFDFKISSINLPDGIVGEQYKCTLSATGGKQPYKWSASDLPDWLQLSPDGQITGTPSSQSDIVLHVEAADSAKPPHNCHAEISIFTKWRWLPKYAVAYAFNGEKCSAVKIKERQAELDIKPFL